jgi:hypothetical protein
MRLTPPAPKTFVISLLLAALALLQQLGLRLPIPEFGRFLRPSQWLSREISSREFRRAV